MSADQRYTRRLANCPHPHNDTAVRSRPAAEWERDHCTTIVETYCRRCGEVVATSGEGKPSTPWPQQ